jgi:hypothetical protein
MAKSIAGIPFGTSKDAVDVPRLMPTEADKKKAKKATRLSKGDRASLMKYRRLMAGGQKLGNYQRKNYVKLEEAVRLNKIAGKLRSAASKANSRKAKSRDGKATRAKVKGSKKAKKSVSKSKRSKK